MIIYALVFLLVLLAADFYYNRTNRRRRLINKIPGPPGLPIIGNLLIGLMPAGKYKYDGDNTYIQSVTDGKHFFKDKVWDVLCSNMEKYGPTAKVQMGNIAMVSLSDPNDVEILLSSQQHIEKGFSYNNIQPWLKTGLLTSHGEKWKQRRKILTSAFHFNVLKKYIEITNENGEKFLQCLENISGESIVSLVPMCSNCTLNIICEAAMGVALDKMPKEEAEKYKNAVYTMGNIIVYRILRPYITDWVMNFLWTLTKLQSETLNTLHSFTNKVLTERKEYHQRSENKYLKLIDEDDDESDEFVYGGRKKRLAMLDLLLSAEMDNLIDNEGIREEVDTFTFEGHDTTAMAMTFTLMLLANHETIQDKARAEVTEIIDKTGGNVRITEIQEFAYLERCIKESLRLYPPVSVTSRYISQDLPLKTCLIPAGTELFLQNYHIHRNAKYWPEPNKFDPDRFLPERSQGRHPFSYVPFSAGPRNCIGQKFALMELKSLIARILYNFKLEPIDKMSDMKILCDIVIRPRYPVRVKFIKIR